MAVSPSESVVCKGWKVGCSLLLKADVNLSDQVMGFLLLQDFLLALPLKCGSLITGIGPQKLFNPSAHLMLRSLLSKMIIGPVLVRNVKWQSTENSNLTTLINEGWHRLKSCLIQRLKNDTRVRFLSACASWCVLYFDLALFYCWYMAACSYQGLFVSLSTCRGGGCLLPHSSR